MRENIKEFLAKFDAGKLCSLGIFSGDKNILTRYSVWPLLELMRSNKIDELDFFNEWRLFSNGDYYNGYCGPAFGNAYKIENINLLDVVFKKANIHINPHYSNSSNNLIYRPEPSAGKNFISPAGCMNGNSKFSSRIKDLKGASELNDLINSLPLNRKETFWTGCVLPQIICGDEFNRLGVFLKTAGIPECYCKNRYDRGKVMFYTEYSLKESALGWDDIADIGRITPDLMMMLNVSGRKYLVVIEAKMFDYVEAGALIRQLEAQKLIIKKILDFNKMPPDSYKHVILLLKPPQADNDGIWKNGIRSDETLLFWGDIIDNYSFLKNTYFYDILQIAVKNEQLITTRGAYEMRVKKS